MVLASLVWRASAVHSVPIKIRSQIALTAAEGSLEPEELEALSGVWKAELRLDDGDRTLTWRLAASGRVRGLDENEEGVWWADSAPTESAQQRVTVSLRVRDWTILAVGERTGLRCTQLGGAVLEGAEDPCHVGECDLTLALADIGSDGLGDLEACSPRPFVSPLPPPPPPPVTRRAFVGRWRMLIDMEGGAPLSYAVVLRPGGTFRTVGGGEGEAAVLGGRWAVWGRGMAKGVAEWGVLPEGTHLWMRVERDASTSTLAGIGGLAGVHESFSLWSEPSLSSPASELAALAGAYSSSAGERGASVASCSGAAYFGTASNEYYRAGRCSMIREEEAEAGRG
ncbi:hypothetical protein EMIHUDRAFT_466724 [Emiliania huxleyi CCMP1516]|uniref:Uncharacterized protein n=2 Tax=Emiliania huxleyi TaxID=2903 RepID=A0A0D3KTA9_EMIH1|nr:hypothetical protein EMIHUDRAFT_466724 [Emiliania huxleyi CCMP1516]EOD38994.1 hypothetical protein EMIHUDRAFT_466724 [Emiliania huxleyi CCMP1516]|eukprot:XP_005791423.1 hypothetical protein EMIHUDRAFT_466724 [Emiliania huxleyi CCMP1516]